MCISSRPNSIFDYELQKGIGAIKETANSALDFYSSLESHPDIANIVSPLISITGTTGASRFRFNYTNSEQQSGARDMGYVNDGLMVLGALDGVTEVYSAFSAMRSGLQFGDTFSGARMFFGGGAEKIAINASSPSEIAWGYGKLSTRQAEILDVLPKPGRFLQLHKSYISPTDLAALTAHTGDEFGLFTLGSQRIVIRGTPDRLEFDAKLSDKLLSQNWKWSAHTHPGLADNVLMASGTPGDRQALQAFNQERSLILNSAGRRSIFDFENDYAITDQSSYSQSFRPGDY
jgi:hypothetical protein